MEHNMVAWRYKFFPHVKKYFTCLLHSLMKYLSPRDLGESSYLQVTMSLPLFINIHRNTCIKIMSGEFF